jgi:hypothetical protein
VISEQVSGQRNRQASVGNVAFFRGWWGFDGFGTVENFLPNNTLNV